jgi:hypothetical protein
LNKRVVQKPLLVIAPVNWIAPADKSEKQTPVETPEYRHFQGRPSDSGIIIGVEAFLTALAQSMMHSLNHEFHGNPAALVSTE